MNCRIVGAICRHNFPQAQRVLISFQRKKAHYFEKKNEKIVTSTNYFIHPCPCFELNATKKRKKPRTFDRGEGLV